MIPRGLMVLTSFFVCLLFFPVTASGAQAEYPPPWPASDLTFTVPFNQGSETDALFSLIKESITPKTGKKITARHVPGKAGGIAWARMVDDAPDGSTLTAVLLPDAYLRILQTDSGIDLDAMALCHIVAYMPATLWVATSSPITSTDEIANAATDAKGNFMVAGPGSYSAGQLAARALDRTLGVRTLYVPYTGTFTAAKAALDKQAEMFWGYSVRVALPGVESATFRPLAVAAAERVPALPETPTFNELGLDIDEGVYIGIAVPAQTPDITQEEISEYFSALAGEASFQTRIAALGFTPRNIGKSKVASFLAEMKRAADEKAENFSLRDQ